MCQVVEDKIAEPVRQSNNYYERASPHNREVRGPVAGAGQWLARDRNVSGPRANRKQPAVTWLLLMTPTKFGQPGL